MLLLKPFVAALPDQDRAWLVIAMASTLAGNFTVLGSIANLIVVEKAARRGVVIGFWDYFRVGAPSDAADPAGRNVVADVALSTRCTPGGQKWIASECSKRRYGGMFPPT